MKKGEKKCRECGALVSEDLQECPECDSIDFVMGEESKTKAPAKKAKTKK